MTCRFFYDFIIWFLILESVTASPARVGNREHWDGQCVCLVLLCYFGYKGYPQHFPCIVSPSFLKEYIVSLHRCKDHHLLLQMEATSLSLPRTSPLGELLAAGLRSQEQLGTFWSRRKKSRNQNKPNLAFSSFWSRKKKSRSLPSLPFSTIIR